MSDPRTKFPRPSFRDKCILVVGGAGFIGSNLVLRLLEDDPSQVIIVDNLLSSELVNIPINPHVRFMAGSIADDLILRDIPDALDYVFHLACFHGNQSSIADPIADHANNTLTSLKLFERLKDLRPLKKVVYAAAGCAVAKKTQDEPAATPEDAPPELFHDSPYAISKLIGELYGNYYFVRHNLPFVKARFQNVYGPREILGAGRWRGTVHTVWRNVTPTFVFKALHQEALPLFNAGEDGRDFIFVDDVVEGLTRAAAYGVPGEAYNIASGSEIRIRDLAALINRLTDNPTPPEMLPPREWDRSGRRFGDPTKSLRTIGFSCSVDIETGLRQTVDWTRANLDVILRCLSRHAHRMPELSKYLL
ncbi:MAG TPA: NAD-dependent epimerase/dehydratase family protein [Xanthobacteraceae bacterium]|nr:NAD-dependent epimerase/dehydratase family protein [Xanthobacteraceae bacterium]